MKNLFSRLPIHYKLYCIVFIACVAALLLAVTVSFFNQKRMIEKQLTDEIQTLADIIIENSRAGLLFEDKKSLETILRSLAAKNSITVGRIYKRSGELFAEYRRQDRESCINGHDNSEQNFKKLEITSTHAHLISPIVVENEAIGQLELEVDLSDSRSNQYAVLFLMAAVLFVGLLLAMLLSSHLLTPIIKPIKHLLELTQSISREKNYHIRATVYDEDELGMLTCEFNNMIEQIEKRDSYLEEQVAVRTKELEERSQDLFEAKEKAEAASRAKSQFLANMSHEIRTPMNAIIGMTHLAMESQDYGQLQRFLGTVKSSAESLLGVLNDILDFSKIEAGQLQLDYRPFNLRQMLEGIVSVMNVPAVEKGLVLQIVEAAEVPVMVVGDDLRIHQILVNLVGNAIKFTEHGAVTMRVGIEPERSHDGRIAVHFSVQDTGIGIAPEKIAQIFNSFEQADSSYARQYGGTGLGLSISKQLTSLMNGEIWVESELGRGSTFHFILDFEEVAEGQVESTADEDDLGYPALKDLHILLVDDNKFNREVAQMILEKEHRVQVAKNGLEALYALGEHSFDLVLMDVQMPMMDGLATTSVIRAMEHGLATDYDVPEELLAVLKKRLYTRNIPIIAMTAHAMGGDKEMCLAAGMDNYITKPFQPKQLSRIFRSLLANHPGWRSLHTAESATSDSFQAGDQMNEKIKLEQIANHLKITTHLGNEQITKLLQAACASMAETLEQSYTAISAQDQAMLERASHTLKGTLLQCGLISLAETADEICKGVREKRQLPYRELIEHLHRGLEALLPRAIHPSEEIKR